MKSKNPEHWLFWLIALTTFVRGFTASVIELGNDEVYYVNYARYFSWSYFDHPPMVGLIIRLFTFDLFFTSELFIRLGSVLFGSLAIFLIFQIGKLVKNPRTGLIAASLYAASLYGGVICGLFILPDTPQSVFWLGALWVFIYALRKEPVQWSKPILWAGLLTGFAIYSKYHAVFLWVGAGGYVLFYKRQWLKSASFYLSILISLIPVALIYFWNASNDFISFTFHQERVSFFSSIKIDALLQEVIGELFYQNPINFVLILLALFSLRKSKGFGIENQSLRLLLWFSLPLWGLVLFMSLFRDTLPHWSGPAFFSLLIIAAAYLDQVTLKFNPRAVQFSLGLYFFIIVIGIGVINEGWFIDAWTAKNPERKSQDITVELYGWKQGRKKFDSLRNAQPQRTSNILLSDRWYPGSHLDFYIAQPLKMKMLVEGPINDIHQYHWINPKVGELNTGDDAWYIATGRYNRNPNETFKNKFERIELVDTLNILRSQQVVEHLYVYYLYDKKN